MKEICLKADKENIDRAFAFIEGELNEIPEISRKDVLRLHMIIDEIFANICNYAYKGIKGYVWISFSYETAKKAVTITFADDGFPYDPLSAKEPDTTLSAKERKAGGLGIFMVKNTVDEISYENTNGKNILILTKIIGGSEHV